MLGHVVPPKPNAKRIRIRRVQLTDLENKCQKIEDIYDKIKCLHSELAKCWQL